MYYVYVLRSVIDGRLYKGFTANLQKRVKQHNSGKTKSTKGYRPWELVYYEKYDTLDKAIKREKFLKTGIGREFLKDIIKKGRVAQLNSASDFGSEGWGFESLRGHE